MKHWMAGLSFFLCAVLVLISGGTAVLAAPSAPQPPMTVGNSLTYDFTNVTITGNAWENTAPGDFPGFDGTSYVFLADGSFELDIQVPYRGFYNITVRGANNGNGNRCDKFELNGAKYLVTPVGAEAHVWADAPVGAEAYTDGVCVAKPPVKGFYLNEGSNHIKVAANWGYAAYDSITITALPQKPVWKDGTLFYDCNLAALKGNAWENTAAGNFSGFDGKSYIYLGNGSFELNLDVPETGAYDLSFRAANDNNGNRFDAVYINDVGYQMTLVQTASHQWGKTTVGAGQWQNGVYVAVPPAEGIHLKKGLNKIRVQADWGNCAYDSITLTPKTPLTPPEQTSVCKRVKNGAAVYYPDFLSALENAEAGETLVLLQDVGGLSSVALQNNLTLDLNGHRMEAASANAFKGNHIVDTAAEKGTLIVAESNLILDPDNAQLPVWNGKDGYFFAKAVMQQKAPTISETKDGFRFVFRPILESTELSKACFGNGGADHGLRIAVRLTWTDAAGLAKSQDFLVSEELMNSAYPAQGQQMAFYVQVKGVDPAVYQNLHICSVILQSRGFSAVGQEEQAQ